jgi:hypothetical protein
MFALALSVLLTAAPPAPPEGAPKTPGTVLGVNLNGVPGPVTPQPPAPPAAPDPKAKPVPTDAECAGLPQVKPPFAFSSGEQLEFDLDAVGAQAGKLYMTVLPLDKNKGELPIRAEAKNNTFFAKIRRVNGGGTSYLNPKTLRPIRFVEDYMENDAHRYADVVFRPKDHGISVDFKEGAASGHRDFKYANEGLDLVGALYLLRQLPLQVGTPVCFDTYGVRKMWRVFGKVEAKEHVSLPVGEFEAYHLTGTAVRTDRTAAQREIHIWISADGKRLPLVAMGVIDLGAVRATLTAFTRKDQKARAEGKETLKW